MLSEKRHQNTGVKAVNRWINLIGYFPNKNVSGFFTHILCRLDATTFANNGGTMTNLKRFGQWYSNTCAEGYINNSTKMKANYLSFLGRTLSDSLTKIRNTEKPAKRTNEEHHKKPKLEKCGNSLSIETHETTVVYNNCAMYSDSKMNFGFVPPPPPLHAPPKNNQNLLSFYIKKWVSLGVMKNRISFK